MKNVELLKGLIPKPNYNLLTKDEFSDYQIALTINYLNLEDSVEKELFKKLYDITENNNLKEALYIILNSSNYVMDNLNMSKDDYAAIKPFDSSFDKGDLVKYNDEIMIVAQYYSYYIANIKRMKSIDISSVYDGICSLKLIGIDDKANIWHSNVNPIVLEHVYLKNDTKANKLINMYSDILKCRRELDEEFFVLYDEIKESNKNE